MKKPRNRRLDTISTIEFDIGNVDLNSGTNRPKSMRAGPRLVADAAKPAEDRLRN